MLFIRAGNHPTTFAATFHLAHSPHPYHADPPRSHIHTVAPVACSIQSVHHLAHHPSLHQPCQFPCMCACIYLGPSPTHFINLPHSHPISLASHHQSLGVLCAQLEWPCWALPLNAVGGPCIPNTTFFMETCNKPCGTGLHSQFSTHYYLSRQFFVIWPWDHYPAINL